MNRDRFIASWADVRDEILSLIKNQGMPEDAVKWVERSLEYNMLGGKMNRGITVIDTFEILRGRPLTDEEFHSAAILAWSVEMLQAYSLVVDDVMDGSLTRRGQPCWFRLDDVGTIAINDAFVIMGVATYIVKVHLRNHPAFPHFIELFDDINLKTELGQLLDLITAPEGNVNLTKFSSQRHQLIVRYKTSYYSFYLPVALGMRLAGITSPKDLSFVANMPLPHSLAPIAGLYQKRLNSFLSLYEPIHKGISSFEHIQSLLRTQQVSAIVLMAVQYVLLLFCGIYAAFYIPYDLCIQVTRQTKEALVAAPRAGFKAILRIPSKAEPTNTAGGPTDHYKIAMEIGLLMGEYFQSHDDFLDCFAPPGHLGKIGTDIIDNKCSWCINTALDLATDEQRKILDENYGRKDPKSEAAVKDVFTAPNIDLPTRFAAYETGIYKQVSAIIAAVPETGGMKKAVFWASLKKVYKRTK